MPTPIAYNPTEILYGIPSLPAPGSGDDLTADMTSVRADNGQLKADATEVPA